MNNEFIIVNNNLISEVMKTNPVVDKSFSFATSIVMVYKLLKESLNEYVLSKQILRCGTSIGANIEEAEGGLSKKDFSVKMGIAYREARETRNWLRLLRESGDLSNNMFISLMRDIEELLKILFSIIRNSKN
jgi:four helix bundle protein